VDGALECSELGALRGRVDTILGETAGSETAPSVQVRVTVLGDRADELRFLVVVQNGSQRGERELSGDSCAELTHAAAAVIALAIEPALSGAKPDSQFRSATPAAVDRVLPNSRQQPPQRSVPTSAALVLPYARLEAQGSIGVLPEPALGVGGAIGARVGMFELELFGSYWLPQTAESIQAGVAGEFRALEAGGLLCARTSTKPRVRGCLGADHRWIGAEGRGVALPANRTASRAGVVASTGLSWPLAANASVTAQVTATWSTNTVTFFVENERGSYVLSRISGRAAVGAQVSF
jgi:hypothetical protein